MPRASKFRCPIAGCAGYCRVRRSSPAPFASRDTRVRICRVCDCRFKTREVVDGPIQLGLVGIDTDQSAATPTNAVK